MRAPTGSRVPEETLRRGLGVVFPAGFGVSLLLIAAGVLLPLAGLPLLEKAAPAGVVTLLATPAAALLWVGGYALRHRDGRLAFTAAGILALVLSVSLLGVLG